MPLGLPVTDNLGKWKDGRKETSRWKDGRMEGRKQSRWKDGRKDGRMEGCKNRRKD